MILQNANLRVTRHLAKTCLQKFAETAGETTTKSVTSSLAKCLKFGVHEASGAEGNVCLAVACEAEDPDEDTNSSRIENSNTCQEARYFGRPPDNSTCQRH
mmetsp:Transcript_112874/g.319289  ORF Transcript_112874/g.319289 Transcript_112874/m.319289 type:complete len:101 (-) Transcript_112874:361-663(-)